MNYRVVRQVISPFIIFALILAGCAQPSPEPQAPAELPKLRVAVLPVLDSIPLYVAEQEGYFTQRGVDVELVPVGSAPERDQLIASGQVDGMVNEILSTIFSNKEETRLQVIRYARAAAPGQPLFSIVAAKDSGIETVDQLKGVQVGISTGTVIEYLTDRLLERSGFSEEEIAKIAVSNIRDRMALLTSGELKAGTMPEPLTSLLVLQGAKVVIDDTAYPELSFSTLTFRKEVIDQKPEALRSFLAGFEDAVDAINANRGAWNELLAEKQLVPEPLLANFQLPTFVEAGVPTPEQLNDMADWARENGLLEGEVSYEETINPAFLPE